MFYGISSLYLRVILMKLKTREKETERRRKWGRKGGRRGGWERRKQEGETKAF